MTIYHIATARAARDAASAGTFVPDGFAADGFIHCSYAHQVVSVANARFRGRADLVLLAIDSTRAGCDVRDEDLAGEGRLFPHLYGPLPMSAVVAVHAFPCGPDGRFALPMDVLSSG